jgi:hypothetical protein
MSVSCHDQTQDLGVFTVSFCPAWRQLIKRNAAPRAPESERRGAKAYAATRSIWTGTGRQTVLHTGECCCV